MKNATEEWYGRYEDARKLGPVGLREFLERWGVQVIGVPQWKLQSLYADRGGKRPGGRGQWAFLVGMVILAALITWGVW